MLSLNDQLLGFQGFRVLSNKDTRGGHRQKKFADTSEKKMKLPVEQIVEQIRVFVKWCKSEKLTLLIESEEKEPRK